MRYLTKYFKLVECDPKDIVSGETFLLASKLDTESTVLADERIFPDFKRRTVDGTVSVFNIQATIIQ